jgi:hypothetical protein
MMASERQIAANRRNAQKSTGPRSASGRKRSGQNALRHGLARPVSLADFEKQVEDLARQISEGSDDPATLALARIAAEAELELSRIRQVRKAIIERSMIFGGFESPSYFRSDIEEIQWHVAELEWPEGSRPSKPLLPVMVDPSATLPEGELERTAEAVRRILSDLASIGRYESRAASRRERAIRTMIKMTSMNRKKKTS